MHPRFYLRRTITLFFGILEFSAAGLVLPATAAPFTISGRVSDIFGRGIFGVCVKITGSNGNVRVPLTSSFGYYAFDGLAAGETYCLTTAHKNYQFSAQIISANEDREDINCVANGNLK